MNGIYVMIDELHKLVTSREFLRVRYPDAKKIRDGLFVFTKYDEDGKGFSITFINTNDKSVRL